MQVPTIHRLNIQHGVLNHSGPTLEAKLSLSLKCLLGFAVIPTAHPTSLMIIAARFTLSVAS